MNFPQTEGLQEAIKLKGAIEQANRRALGLELSESNGVPSSGSLAGLSLTGIADPDGGGTAFEKELHKMRQERIMMPGERFLYYFYTKVFGKKHHLEINSFALFVAYLVAILVAISSLIFISFLSEK